MTEADFSEADYRFVKSRSQPKMIIPFTIVLVLTFVLWLKPLDGREIVVDTTFILLKIVPMVLSVGLIGLTLSVFIPIRRDLKHRKKLILRGPIDEKRSFGVARRFYQLVVNGRAVSVEPTVYNRFEQGDVVEIEVAKYSKMKLAVREIT